MKGKKKEVEDKGIQKHEPFPTTEQRKPSMSRSKEQRITTLLTFAGMQEASL
jgi:hypothetical protein